MEQRQIDVLLLVDVPARVLLPWSPEPDDKEEAHHGGRSLPKDTCLL